MSSEFKVESGWFGSPQVAADAGVALTLNFEL
jgi:hypothetical protein